MTDTNPHLAHIEMIEKIATEAPEAGFTLGEIIGKLDQRAFGVMLFLMAIPCAIPFLYGVPQIMSLPMIVLAGQMAIGKRQPWLPERLANRSLSASSLDLIARVGRKYFGWTEWFARPRLGFLTHDSIRPVIGVLLCVFCASILIPLPMTNSVPALAVALVAVGFIARDGILTVGGLIIGALWVGMLVFFGEQALRLIIGTVKAWAGMG